MPATSSSDDSEDEDAMRRLREATDQSLLTNSMFTGNVQAEDAQTVNVTAPSKPARQSQRYIEVDERLTNDMQVTESMQNFMHKKLNQILEKRIEFVEIASPVDGDDPPEDVTSAVRLFRDSDPIVLDVPNTDPEPVVKQKRHKKLKRRLANEDGVRNETEMLAASVVSEKDIEREVSAWKVRPQKPQRHFEYVAHKSTKQLHLKEPENEFTKMRKKNNWNENKIARK